MSKSIRKILVFLFILVTVIMLSSCVKAETVKETTEANDGNSTIESGSIIIGVTKFDSQTVITAARAATAGANDVLVYVSKNGSTENYSYPKMYYYLLDEWYEYDETGKLESIEPISSLDIYYVDNEKKPDIKLPTQSTYTVSFMDGEKQVNSKTVVKGEKVGALPKLTKDNYSLTWVDQKGTEITADTTITSDTVVTAKWTENAKQKITFIIDGDKSYAEDYVGTKVVFTPTKAEDDNYKYEFAGWYDSNNKKNEILTIQEQDITLYAHWNKIIKDRTVDLSEANTITNQSTEFINTYYNMPNTNGGAKTTITGVDEDIYYINLGKYTGVEETPTKLTINGTEYGTENASLSIGNNNFIQLPVWKINDEGNVLVALTWLCAEALPTEATDVVISGQTIHVTLYDSDVTGNTLTLASAGKFGTKAGYTHDVTLNGETNTVTMKRGYGTMGLGITLKYGDELITTSNYANQVIFRMNVNDKMSMGLVTTENTQFTYAMYPKYMNGVITEATTRNFAYKLALPGKGVITVNLVCEDVIGTTAEVGTLSDLKAALTLGNSVVLTDDVKLDEVVTIAAGVNVVFNTNGHDVTSTKSVLFNVDGGTLEITGNGKMTATGEVARVYNGGEVKITGGTFTSTSNLVLYSGSVKKDNMIKGGKVTISGGTFTGQEGCVCVTNGGELNITGGEFTAIDNAVIAGNGNYADTDQVTATTINISGGTFNGNITTAGYIAMGIYHPQKGTLNVTGGTFNITKGSGIIMRGGALTLENAEFNYNNEGNESFAGWAGDKKSNISVGYDVVQCTHETSAGYPYDVQLVNVNTDNYRILTFAE